MAKLAHDFDEFRDESNVGFFYYRFEEVRTRNSTVDFLQTLQFVLCKQFPALQQKPKAPTDDADERRNPVDILKEDIKDRLKELRHAGEKSEVESLSLYCFIDGLDELYVKEPGILRTIVELNLQGTTWVLAAQSGKGIEQAMPFSRGQSIFGARGNLGRDDC